MQPKPAHLSQRVTAILLLCLLLLQSCYQGAIIIPQVSKPESNQEDKGYVTSIATEPTESEGIEAKELSWTETQGTAAVSEDLPQSTQALALGTNASSQAPITVADKPLELLASLPTFTTTTSLRLQSPTIQSSTQIREEYLQESRKSAEQSRTNFGHSLPSPINNTPVFPLNTQATAKQIGSSTNVAKSNKPKLASGRDQQLGDRQKRAAQNRTKIGHSLSAKKDQAHVLNTPLNWRSREGHILLELYEAQGFLRARVADKFSSQLIDDLPATVFPGISLSELASYSAIKMQQYLHIQLSKAPVLGQVIFSQGGLSGGVKGHEKGKAVVEEESSESEEEEGEIEGAAKASGLATGELPYKALTTLWHMGQTLGEEHYLTTALYRLEERANQGDGMASYRLIKKLSSLGNLAEFQASQVKVLPLNWQNKSAEELQKIVAPYYDNALAQLSAAQSNSNNNMPQSVMPADKLRMLKLKYHYYQLLGPAEPSSKELLVSINKELDQLTLQKMSESLNLKRKYLSYLVKKASQMDLQANAEQLRTHIEYINEQIAKKAKDAFKIEKKKGERETLMRLAARVYRELGDLSARFKYHSNTNIGKSDEWQHSYYHQASKLKDAVGTYRLGLLYDKKGGLHESQDKAHQAFEESAIQGYCLAEHKLAVYHEKEGNDELARLWHERAAKQGHPESLYALYKQDSQKSLISQESKYLEQAAQAGHGEAQYALGKHHWEQGEYQKAIKWHNEAACQGIRESYSFLGLASAKGLGTKQDSSVAMDHYLRAEKVAENPMARYGRARLYEKGKGVARNLETALKLYTEASLLGHAKAAYQAGRIHLAGTLFGSEPKQVYKFLEQAAKGGIYKASLLLARMYEYGWGGDVDLKLALDWYSQAALDLNKDRAIRAQGLYQLGWLYKLGKGVDLDEAAALGFFDQAAIVGQDKHLQLQADNEGLAKQLQAFQKKLDQSAEVIEEKESVYKKLQEESKTKLAQQEADFKNKLQEEKLAQEAVYKKIQEKLDEQEVTIKKLLEKEKLAQENLDEAIKVFKLLAPHGEAIVKALVSNSIFFRPDGDAFTETDMAVLVNHPSFQKLTHINLASLKLSAASLKIFAPCLKGLTNLQILNLGWNQEIGAVGMQALAWSLEGLTNLQRLDLWLNKIGDVGMQTLAPNLKNLTNLQILELSDNQIGSVGMKALSSNLEGLTNLQELSLGWNKIGDVGMKDLAPNLKKLTNLQKIFLHSNQIGAVGMQNLAPNLKELTNLQTLLLMDNQIGVAGMQDLATVLKGLTNLKKLYLRDNQIGLAGMQALATVLKGVTNLKELDLDRNQIGAVGMKDLAPNLKGLTNLQRLDLGSNQIGAVGMEALAPNLKGLTNLQRLNLGSNQIGAVGMEALAPNLEGLTNLQVLSLGWNKIGDVGMQSLAPNLKGLTNLKELYLYDNQIGDVGMQALTPALRGLTNLQKLWLMDNPIGDVGMQALAEYPLGLKHLEELNLNNNKIGDAGMQALVLVLKGLIKLAKLELNDNQIGDAGTQALAPYLKELRNLKELYLNNNQISDAGAKVLGEHLQEVTGKTITLFENNISTETQAWLTQRYSGISWNFSS
jgi:TPR repeat protein/Ran GTPase-activating protein (RanGAP) involved in mRNA processing and transport